MEFLIIRGLSSILEAILWTYFIVSFCKIFNITETPISKKQIVILAIANLISVIMRQSII